MGHAYEHYVYVVKSVMCVYPLSRAREDIL
jgi:hypothetical protein